MIPTLITANNALTDVATCDFTSGITNAYNHYMVIFNIKTTTDQNTLQFHASTNAGVAWGVNIVSTAMRGYNPESSSTGGINYLTGADLTNNDPQIITDRSQLGSDANQGASGILHLFNPSNTSSVTHWYCTTVWDAFDEIAAYGFFSGYYNTTDAINGLRFYTTAGTLSGCINLYGIE